MPDLSTIHASPAGPWRGGHAIVVTVDCAEHLVELGLLTEDRSDEEQAALLALAAALDLARLGKARALAVIQTREG